MSLRTILYGYEVKNGKPVVLEIEAKVVCDIFADYIGGKSLKPIAAELTAQGISYYLDKSVWTKNLISRIIANPKYAGADGYPAIISQTDFDLANKRKLDMGGTRAELPEITTLIKSKLVCSCCGQNMGRRNKWGSREKWLCPSGCKVDTYLGDREIFLALLNTLNRVRRNPELLRINTIPIEYSPSIEVIRQNKEIERVKEQTGVEFGVLSKMILKCVEHKYECCPLDRSRAMTEALMDKYRNLPIITELDITLIRETVQKIAANRDGNETLIGFFSVMSQAESESISANVKWGIQKRMKNGTYSLRFKMLGLRKGDDGIPYIIADEAEVVRTLFQMILDGASLGQLKDFLESNNIKTLEGKDVWSISVIRYMLSNEKYVGDVLYQKTFRTDCISKKAKVNRGEVK